MVAGPSIIFDSTPPSFGGRIMRGVKITQTPVPRNLVPQLYTSSNNLGNLNNQK